MRYPLTHKTRQSVIVAVLLLAVGALAAAAAHVSRSGTARGDIALLDPIPDRAPASLGTPSVRTVAPLFAAGSTAARTVRITGEGAGSFGPGLAGTRRFDLVPENRSGGSSGFRDFAGERTRNGNARSASGGGSAGFGGGGGGFGGGGWGGVSGTEREEGRAPVAQASRPARTTTRAGSSGGGGATVANAGAGPAVVTLPATASPVAVAAVGQPGGASPLGSSPGTSPTPEPLTLLLVGSGLAGLYGARKHLAG